MLVLNKRDKTMRRKLGGIVMLLILTIFLVAGIYGADNWTDHWTEDWADDGLTVSTTTVEEKIHMAQANQLKNKTWTIGMLGDDYEIEFYLWSDQEGTCKGKWNDFAWLGLGTITVSDAWYWGGIRFVTVTMTDVNVTGFTPYCYIRTTTPNAVPKGFAVGEDDGIHGVSNWTGVEIHSISDEFRDNEAYFYVGAGWTISQLYINWVQPAANVLYFASGDATESTATDVFTYGIAGQKLRGEGLFSKPGYHQVSWYGNSPLQMIYSLECGVEDWWIQTVYEQGYYACADMYPVWEANTYTICFDGNGATGGSMDAIYNVSIEDTIRIPANGFANNSMLCSFQGWKLQAAEPYADYRDQQEIAVRDLARAAGVEEENGATIVLYAVWDQFPVIDACDQYVDKESLENGTVTEQSILAEATATDAEDGTLVPGKTFVLLNFCLEDFLHLGKNGWCTVTFQAVDSVGNQTFQTIRIYVSDPTVQDLPAYIRFVDEQNYEKTDPGQGGLYTYSVWYENTEYAAALKEAFERQNTKTFVTSHTFGRDKIADSKEYVDARGPGNLQEEGALERWMEAFL